MSWEKDLQRWVAAHLIDAATADRIRQFEQQSGSKGWRWPATLAVAFGALMLCAGVLLLVAAHWEDISPQQRISLVLAMTAIFHVAAGFLGGKVPAIGIALHGVGTAALGAGIFLAGQIFNLQEHWPGGIMLWALGAVLAWLLLRQWPQALLAAVLIPWWLGGEWSVATQPYDSAGHIEAQGFLLLSILYFSVPQKESNRALRVGLMLVGCLVLIPFLCSVMLSEGFSSWHFRPQPLPGSLAAVGYASAYLPILILTAAIRKKQAIWIFGSAAWVLVLGFLSRSGNVERNPWIYIWVGFGACLLCWWGVHDSRRLFINYGTAIFTLNLLAFYYSEVMQLDKMGRSMGLILLGVIFLAGGWVLSRLRSDLIARAAARQK